MSDATPTTASPPGKAPTRLATRGASRAWPIFAFITTLGCGDGHLDAFSRQTPLAGGGVDSGGSAQGGAATGGDKSSGGSGGGAAGVAGTAGGVLLIDDFEGDTNETTIPGGWWYLTQDGTSTIQANYASPTTRAGAPTQALRAYGSGFKNWCFVGLDLPGKPNLDASAYTRFSFWARAEPSSMVRQLGIDLLDSTNVNVQDSSPIHFQTAITLSTEWVYYSLSFAEFTPNSGSSTTRVNRAELSGAEFWVYSPDSFDFYLDDVALVP